MNTIIQSTLAIIRSVPSLNRKGRGEGVQKITFADMFGKPRTPHHYPKVSFVFFGEISGFTGVVKKPTLWPEVWGQVSAKSRSFTGTVFSINNFDMDFYGKRCADERRFDSTWGPKSELCRIFQH